MASPIRLPIAVLLAGLLWPISGGAVGLQVAGTPGELSDREAAVHVLTRLGYGARPGDVDRVLEMGIAAYIEAQLHPETLPENPDLEGRLAGYPTLAMSSREILEKYPPPGRVRQQMRRRGSIDTTAVRRAARASYTQLAELGQARLTRIIYSERQLQEVMVDFWLNHFNVYSRKGPIRQLLIDYERDVIRPQALGRFRDLLGAVARSPAMLFYLDNWLSTAPEGAPRAAEPPRRRRAASQFRDRARGLNENYARELLELHTLGVDGGYTQHDVIEVARAFTGWTVNLRSGGFVFRPDLHDAGSKVVLGRDIASGGSIQDGESVLDQLARHPSTARFIATKLARRFVSDEPPEALVEQAAAVFTETDGDIREVVRAIVTSPQFFSREAYRSKVKTPLEWVASSVRGLGINPPNLRPLLGALRRLDQPLYGAEPPTGYPDVADAWVSSSALLARAELGGRFAGAATRGRALRGAELEGPTLEGVLERLLPGIETERLRGVIESHLEASASRQSRLRTALSLALASPEFQRK